MSILKELKAEYNQENWIDYISSLDIELSQEIPDLPVDANTFAVACYHLGNASYAKEWFRSDIPALDGKSANMVLKSELSGIEIIRALLMRFP